MSNLPIFKPAQNTSAFLKAGMLGFAGSGKTKTASKIIIGLVELMRARGIDYANRPVYFLDSETGSDWVRPDFEKAGIPLMVAKTRAFADLVTAIKEAEKNGAALIVDSLTHFWKELCDSYQKKKGRSRLEFQDWSYLKGEQGWQQFTDLYINSNLHIVLAGRAGFEYDYFVDDNGKKNLEKTGIKMKAENETGFEPSLLILMERHTQMDGNRVEETWRTAQVLKDRSTLLDGKEFINPTFKDFLPHIELLNLGGAQVGVDASRTSDHIITTNKRDWQPTQRKIVIDEIQSLIVMHVPGQAAADKQRKLQLLRTHFNAMWTEIEEVMPLLELRTGYDKLHRELEGVPSRYAAFITASTTEMNDEIPETGSPGTAPSLLDKLLGELSQAVSAKDVLHIALEASLNKDLTFDDRTAFNAAVMKRQVVLGEAGTVTAKNPASNGNGNNGHNGNGDGDKAGDVDGPAPAQTPPPKTEEPPQQPGASGKRAKAKEPVNLLAAG